MKKLIALLLLIACLSAVGQVVTTKIVKVANATTTFNENLLSGIEILNIADTHIYLTLKSIPATKSISTCVLDVDLKELTSTVVKAKNGLIIVTGLKDTIKLGGTLTEPTTITQNGKTFKILDSGHGSIFSQTGIAYTKIDTASFGDSTLITKLYAKKYKLKNDSILGTGYATNYKLSFKKDKNDSVVGGGYFTNFKALLKEDKANKENTTVDNNTTKYPTVNLLKTYADTKAPLFTGTTGFIPIFTGTNTIGDSYLQYNGVNSLYVAGIYSSTGGMVQLRDTYANGANQTFMGIGFNSSPGYDWTIGKYSNNTEGLFQIRDQSGSIALSINELRQITFPQLASTNPRLLSASSTGQLTPVTDGVGVLKSNGSGTISYINDSQQTLSGTNVTWDLANGKDATITLTGNTVITLSNATQGLSGTLYVTNPSTVYTITFAGYVNDIDPFIELASNVVITYAGYRGDYTFKYNGSQMKWNGCPNRKHL